MTSLTAKNSVDFILASFDGGADGLLPKPFSFEDLLARVQCHIRSPNDAQAESTLVHGEVSLDLLTRRVIAGRVTAAGIERDLTASEFTMLKFFSLAPGPSYL